VDYHFWDLNPLGYHLTNIMLHAMNCGLVVMIADRVLKGTQCSMQAGWGYTATLLLAGLLWGIHPLRVESVAWVTERKDVLNGLFALSSVLAYMEYVSKKESGAMAWLWYPASLVLFACSLMAKSVTVILPVMLLVLDRYPLGRLRRENVVPLLVEKLPFLTLSLLMTIVTIHFAGDTSYLVSNDMFPWHERLLVSGHALIQYLRYLLWPAGITPYHIIPDPVPVLPFASATLAVVCLTVMLLWILRSKVWIGTVWLLFIIPLLPVLAFFQNGDQEYAARFTYLPAIAPSIMAAYLLGPGARKLHPPMNRLLVTIVVLVLSWNVMVSFRLITIWDNGGTMWTRVIEHAPSSSAYWRRAMYNVSVGNNRAAVQDYTAAIRLITPVWKPHIHNFYAHRGEALMAQGNYPEAVADLTAAIGVYPYPFYFRLRGESLKKLGHMAEAEADLERAGNEQGPLGWYFRDQSEKGNNI
jgi:hypothetical protein